MAQLEKSGSIVPYSTKNLKLKAERVIMTIRD